MDCPLLFTVGIVCFDISGIVDTPKRIGMLTESTKFENEGLTRLPAMTSDP